MKVYGHPMSTCTRKVLVTLAEKGHDAEFVMVDLMKGAHKQPEHMARHPFGVVPVFEDDDGFQIYESRAIIRYLDRKLSGPSLTPTDLHELGRMEQWISVEQSYVTPQIMTIVMNLMFGKMMGKEPDMPKVEAAKVETAKCLDVLEKGLAGHDFLAGKTFSLADITFLPYITYLIAAGQGSIVTERSNVSKWWNRISERPTWKKIAGQ